MLRYKKHKRQADGQVTNVTQMDDTDREVSSFTDRAFRSLSVAEEETFNDVPHVLSPIRGLSSKYHLGIFNLSVRKTQPLAQLPTTPRQYGKWAPTFQPLLTYAKVGLTDVKTNINKLYVPVPRGCKQRSKVSSLIQTFDNIENEIPNDSPLDTRLLFSKDSHKDIQANPKSETVEKADIGSESILECINLDDSHPNGNNNVHRRTAREVFLESQTKMCSRLPGSPLVSSGLPLTDQAKKAMKNKDSLRRTAFLHSEHSAFKSWSDINRKIIGGDESDSSIPGTPPIPQAVTPCSPLLQRAISGMKARDGRIELGWTSPASSVSSSFDANQMLRTVPPLPNRRNTKQNRDSYMKAARTRTPLNVKNQDVIKIDEGHLASKEPVNWTNKVNKSKSPVQGSHTASPNNSSASNNSSEMFLQQKEEGQAKIISTENIEMSEATSTEVKETENEKPPTERIKTLIQQIEKEAIKEIMPLHFTEKKHSTRKVESVDVATTLEKSPPISYTLSGSSIHIPPWRKTKSSNQIVPEKNIQSTSVAKRVTTAVPCQENITLCKEVQEEKPSSFNISNLLTPVIRRKNIQEALEENVTMTPPINITNNDQDQREIILYRKRDDYKSKATSLLFNLKDMRKRVKSTYNPANITRNGFENNLIKNVNMQESVAHTNNLPDVNKLVYETGHSNHTYFEENLRSTRETECISKLVANESDNYLSLSPMDQFTEHQTGEISEEKCIPDANFTQEEKEGSQCLSTNKNHISKEIDYPSLNFFNNSDTYVGEKNMVCTEDSIACIKNTEVHFLSRMENLEEIKHNVFINVTSDPCTCVIKTSMDIVPKQSKTCFPSEEYESKRIVDHDESEKQVSKDDVSKDILQYFAVHNCNELDGMESNVKSGFLESQIEKEECHENVTEEIPRAESSCAEELKMPLSVTPFKPNLFYLKDNKIKSSPVTKSVRLPLFRSLSEDCLVFKKLNDNYVWRIGDFIDVKESNGISTDTLSTNKTEISKVSKHQKHLTVSLTTESSKQEAMEDSKESIYKEEAEDQILWRKGHSICNEKNKHEVEESNAIKMTKASRSTEFPGLEETLFHPVETCVSEVAGPSPECNTLIVQNVSDSTKELRTGEHISCPCIDTENTIDSPIDNGILQFEDSVSFIEDIACSTITSPMSESVTCSIVASPMSVNTQSSGFTTALSALEDLPSPPSTSINTRNGKFNFLLPEQVIPLDSEPKTTNLVKQEKASSLELQKMHAKPPAVPPKTEKALRRAKRLTKKRRKTDMPQKDVQESDVVLDVSSPIIVTSTLVTPQSHHKLMTCTPRSLKHEDIISESSTPSLPLTQRKLLLDPDSGRYFMVDIPVCLLMKNVYDPETGQYLKMSLPPSQNESPAFEMSDSPYIMYPGLTPVPVSSIVPYKGTAELMHHENGNTCESQSLWNDREEDSVKMHNFISCDSRDQRTLGTPLSMDRITSRSSDIISMKDIDDFAMEAVS
ncbi:cardiac-enriched FHL2-interacting protein isoform 1-T4 [Anomaloglossus baeobatrachus]|uniref:cardiac-enriched FHL2-interacting protein n=1 Tax=Anomaloglossus baeobatrachus TaxID=238106 RepID=UPI003F50ADD2